MLLNRSKQLNMIHFKQFKVLTLTVAIAFSCMYACKSEKQTTQEDTKPVTVDPATLVSSETKLMLDYLNELGDYVNSRAFPSLIKASSVYEGLGGNQLVIDIRTPEEFSEGHIKGAVNVSFSELVDYFENSIVPFELDKIILISKDGQESSYATCLLRLMGYGNVYSMRWGMSSWSPTFAENGWKKAISADFEEMLVKEDSKKASPSKLPELNTGKQTGEEILLVRIAQLFEEGTAPAHISASDVFEAHDSFYIMNYIRRDKYEAGHIPGAIRYKPQATLGIVTEMSTIPTDKPSVVYCGTGHNSGFVTAYLRLFGYDAKTLAYGNNSFMYNKMIEERETLSWLPFTDEEVNDFPLEK